MYKELQYSHSFYNSNMMLQDGGTALYWAAVYGRVEVVQLLVKYGAAVDIKDEVCIIVIVV